MVDKKSTIVQNHSACFLYDIECLIYSNSSDLIIEVYLTQQQRHLHQNPEDFITSPIYCMKAEEQLLLLNHFDLFIIYPSNGSSQSLCGKTVVSQWCLSLECHDILVTGWDTTKGFWHILQLINIIFTLLPPSNNQDLFAIT